MPETHQIDPVWSPHLAGPRPSIAKQVYSYMHLSTTMQVLQRCMLPTVGQHTSQPPLRSYGIDTVKIHPRLLRVYT